MVVINVLQTADILFIRSCRSAALSRPVDALLCGPQRGALIAATVVISLWMRYCVVHSLSWNWGFRDKPD
jgi:hypothetical protein